MVSDGTNHDGAAKKLRYGWTTGACATAATKAAFEALITGQFPPTVTIKLPKPPPKGQVPEFTPVDCLLVDSDLKENSATAGIIKDAGDDPDVTHGATILVTVSQQGEGVIFKAGKGVGTITKKGLPIPPGEPAINPVPREMMKTVIEDLAKEHGIPPNATIEISVPNGEQIAKKTWNGRLGIVGGISILGTTGVVVPYSCSAWIHSIHRGIDVARAGNIDHIGAAVGNMSEKLIINKHQLEETSLIDMGDFVGGMLKYLSKNPVPKITIAGGFGKMSKLANGAVDLHSKRSEVDKIWLAALLAQLGANKQLVEQAKTANTALEILLMAKEAQLNIGELVAQKALEVVEQKLPVGKIAVEILICDRTGRQVGRAASAAFK